MLEPFSVLDFSNQPPPGGRAHMCHSRAPECMNDWRCRRVAGADGRAARYLRLAGLRQYGRSDGLALRSPDLISSDPASRRQGDDRSMNDPDADEADFPIEPGLPIAPPAEIRQLCP